MLMPNCPAIKMSRHQAQTLVFVGFIYVIGCLDTNKLFSNVACCLFFRVIYYPSSDVVFADDWINCGTDNIFR